MEGRGDPRGQVPERLLHVRLRVPHRLLALLAAHVLLLLLRKVLRQEADGRRGRLSIRSYPAQSTLNPSCPGT